MNILVSYNWLKEYIETSDPAKELAKKLTLSGPTIDRIKKTSPGFSNCVVAEILEVKSHPGADKLRLARVNTGLGERTVVCGAPNIGPGQKVPLAKSGATLAGGYKVEKRMIRGVESDGMLCSPRELDLYDDHSGILILPNEMKTGADLAKSLKLEDHIFEAEITSNRPDMLSMIGLAREAAAASNSRFIYREPRIALPKKSIKPLTIEVEDGALCPRYLGIVMDNVRVGPSPWWLQKKLIASGVRPINNIVDITNYVMLEYGQPLHAFDYSLLSGNAIIVRPAKNGEKIVALDGREYALTPRNLIIADAVKVVAVAGVMGGEYSSISGKTDAIVIESANFNPLSVRKTSRSLKLISDSSLRFEKGLPVELPLAAIKKAVMMVREVANGKPVSPVIDKRSKKAKKISVALSLDEIPRRLGVVIPFSKIRSILVRLGFSLQKHGSRITVNPPYWREGDISIPEDIIEEIARVYGYHNLPTVMPEGEIPIKGFNREFYWEKKAKDVLSLLGLVETYTYSMTSGKLLKSVGINPESCIKIDNILSEEWEFLRITLAPSLLEIFSQNQNFQSELRLFEIAKVYLPRKGSAQLPDEPLRLAGGISAKRSPEELFFEVKGIIEALFQKMNIAEVNFNMLAAHSNIWSLGRTASIETAGKSLGQIGVIGNNAQKAFDLDDPVVMFNLDFNKMVEFASVGKPYTTVPKYPGIELDISVVVKKSFLWQDIERAILELNNPLVQQLELFDVYQGKGIDQGQISLAFRVRYLDKEKTLRLEEAELAHNEIKALLREEFQGVIR